MEETRFGEVEGVTEGDLFSGYDQLREAGVHNTNQSGIVGRQNEGAESIVLNGGYKDDQDFGHVIVYTGHGGVEGHRHVRDQEFSRGNLALALSCDRGLPVRVIRGPKGDPDFSPAEAYRYDGLYYVEDYWHERDIESGFLIYRYRLVKEDPQTDLSSGARRTPRAPTTIQRIVRNTAVATRVKEMHRYTCQICETQLLTPTGPYAEGAHIRPLGEPHNGADTEMNILCLCPNHHVLFDRGTIYVDDTLRQVRWAFNGGLLGELRTHDAHPLSEADIEYHRQHIAVSP